MQGASLDVRAKRRCGIDDEGKGDGRTIAAHNDGGRRKNGIWRARLERGRERKREREKENEREREEEREERSPLKYAPNLYQDRSCDWVLHKLSEQIADLAIHFTLALSRAVEPLKQVAQKISLLQIGIRSGVGRGQGKEPNK